MNRRRWLSWIAVLASGAACGGVTPASISKPTTSPSSIASSVPSSPPFLAIAAVMQSPRCSNCHPSDAIPRVGDARKKHLMNVSRKSFDSGLPCTTCHRSQNAPFLHGPPGVPDWKMPDEKHPMNFFGMKPHDLCVRLKDQELNGGKTLAGLRDHFEKDPLVQWAWNPGPGRTTPPITHAQLMTHVDAWIADGAPCPE